MGKKDKKRKIIKMNEQGMVFIPESFGWKEDNVIRIEDFFDTFNEEPLLNYNREKAEFELYFGKEKYILELAEETKNKIKMGIRDKYVDYLIEKLNKGEFVANQVAQNASYPTDDFDIKLYLNNLTDLYNETKAKVVSQGTFCALSTLTTVASAVGVAHFVNTNSSSGFLGLMLTGVLAAASGLTSIASGLYIPDYLKDMLKNKDILNRYKNYIEDTEEKKLKVKDIPEFIKDEGNLTGVEIPIKKDTKNEFESDFWLKISEIKKQLNDIPENKKEEYLSAIKMVVNNYSNGMQELINKKGFGTEEFKFSYMEFMTDIYKELDNIQYRLNNEPKIEEESKGGLLASASR